MKIKNDILKKGYWGVIKYIEDSYVISFPDFYDASTGGQTKEEAVVMAQDALMGLIEITIESNQSLPIHMAYTEIKKQYPNQELQLINPLYISKKHRITIILNESVMNILDQYSAYYGRNNFISKAIIEYTERHPNDNLLFD